MSAQTSSHHHHHHHHPEEEREDINQRFVMPQNDKKGSGLYHTNNDDDDDDDNSRKSSASSLSNHQHQPPPTQQSLRKTSTTIMSDKSNKNHHHHSRLSLPNPNVSKTDLHSIHFSLIQFENAKTPGNHQILSTLAKDKRFQSPTTTTTDSMTPSEMTSPTTDFSLEYNNDVDDESQMTLFNINRSTTTTPSKWAPSETITIEASQFQLLFGASVTGGDCGSPKKIPQSQSGPVLLTQTCPHQPSSSGTTVWTSCHHHHQGKVAHRHHHLPPHNRFQQQRHSHPVPTVNNNHRSISPYYTAQLLVAGATDSNSHHRNQQQQPRSASVTHEEDLRINCFFTNDGNNSPAPNNINNNNNDNDISQHHWLTVSTQSSPSCCPSSTHGKPVFGTHINSGCSGSLSSSRSDSPITLGGRPSRHFNRKVLASTIVSDSQKLRKQSLEKSLNRLSRLESILPTTTDSRRTTRKEEHSATKNRPSKEARRANGKNWDEENYFSSSSSADSEDNGDNNTNDKRNNNNNLSIPSSFSYCGGNVWKDIDDLIADFPDLSDSFCARQQRRTQSAVNQLGLLEIECDDNGEDNEAEVGQWLDREDLEFSPPPAVSVGDSTSMNCCHHGGRRRLRRRDELPDLIPLISPSPNLFTTSNTHKSPHHANTNNKKTIATSSQSTHSTSLALRCQQYHHRMIPPVSLCTGCKSCSDGGAASIGLILHGKKLKEALKNVQLFTKTKKCRRHSERYYEFPSVRVSSPSTTSIRPFRRRKKPNLQPHSSPLHSSPPSATGNTRSLLHQQKRSTEGSISPPVEPGTKNHMFKNRLHRVTRSCRPSGKRCKQKFKPCHRCRARQNNADDKDVRQAEVQQNISNGHLLNSGRLTWKYQDVHPEGVGHSDDNSGKDSCILYSSFQTVQTVCIWLFMFRVLVFSLVFMWPNLDLRYWSFY